MKVLSEVSVLAKKPLLPLGFVAVGSIWLAVLAFQQTVSTGAVWVVGGYRNFGKVPYGSVLEHKVILFNPHTYWMYLQFDTDCGCTIVGEVPGANLIGTQLSPLSWTKIPVRVETAGLGIGQHSQVVWIKVMSESDDEIHLQPIRLQFTVTR